MKSPFLDILVNPDSFFAVAVKEKESLRKALFIMLAGGIAGAAYGYIIGGPTSRMLASVTPGIEALILIFSIVSGFISIFIFWLIWAGILYLISGLFKGKGSFSRVLEFTAYGYIPQIFGSIIALVIAVMYIPQVSIPSLSSASIQNPQAIQEATRALMHDPSMITMMQIVSVVTILFLLWSAHIWIFGMRHARQVSFRDAALSVGIPVVAYAGYMLYTMYSLSVM
jgi:hypothetical protein